MITVIVASALAGFLIARGFVDHSISKPIRRRIRQYHSRNHSKLSSLLMQFQICGHCFGFWVTWPIALATSLVALDQSWWLHLVTIAAAAGLQDLMEYVVGPLSVRDSDDE